LFRSPRGYLYHWKYWFYLRTGHKYSSLCSCISSSEQCLCFWVDLLKSVDLIYLYLVIFFSLEKLYLNKNCLSSLFYPANNEQYETEITCYKPFQNLCRLLLGNIIIFLLINIIFYIFQWNLDCGYQLKAFKSCFR